ncbi:hypothetical protein H9P43_002422 [Blastocladiella emersonii ATCC 22665]|nr:hypothetical protein H9P43_002422 [Blastocladiella emersonii ATCC 22665]
MDLVDDRGQENMDPSVTATSSTTAAAATKRRQRLTTDRPLDEPHRPPVPARSASPSPPALPKTKPPTGRITRSSSGKAPSVDPRDERAAHAADDEDKQADSGPSAAAKRCHRPPVPARSASPSPPALPKAKPPTGRITRSSSGQALSVDPRDERAAHAAHTAADDDEQADSGPSAAAKRRHRLATGRPLGEPPALPKAKPPALPKAKPPTGRSTRSSGKAPPVDLVDEHAASSDDEDRPRAASSDDDERAASSDDDERAASSDDEEEEKKNQATYQQPNLSESESESEIDLTPPRKRRKP